MPLQVAVQMDPLERVNIETDTTFLLMLEAQTRGHDLFVYAPEKLALDDGRVLARGRAANLRAVKGDHHTVGDPEVRELSEFDVVLMRQDPPFDLAYITATYFLEKIHPATLVVNNPAEVRNAPEKLFVTGFPGLQPPTLITADAEALQRLPRQARRHGAQAALRRRGLGRGEAEGGRPQPRCAAGAARDDRPRAGDRPEVHPGGFPRRQAHPAGRRRAGGAINRIPGEGQVRSNLARGGRAEPVGLTARDREICDAIAPELKDRGLLFVGIDVIGDYLTEINVTRPPAPSS